MRWSLHAADLLAQVRCAVVNGELKERLARYDKPKVPAPIELDELPGQFGLNPNVFNAAMATHTP